MIRNSRINLFLAILLFAWTFVLGADEPEKIPDGGYKRVVSLSPALTELVYYLGRGDRLVGRSDACDFPSDAAALPVCGKFAMPDPEKLVALKPDLLLVNDLVNPALEKTFASAGIRVERLQCRGVEEYRSWVEKLGGLLDCREAAEQEQKRVEEELAGFKKLSPLDYSVLLVIWDSPLMVAGVTSFPHAILSLAGAKNAAPDVKREYYQPSREFLAANQPDAVVWLTSGKLNRNASVWKPLKAVRRKKILEELPVDLILRPGPRMFDGVRVLRKALEELMK